MPETATEADLRGQLEQTLAADPSNPLLHYKLGTFLWGRAEAEQGGNDEESGRLRAAASERFLAAAKLNPNDGGPFRFLGHHYARGGDTQRAAKCYQRAVALNPDDAEAGEALCDLLDVEGKESLELAVCKEAGDKSPRAFWAFGRLGYLQVHQRKWSEAIQSLQHAIRGYPICADLWEALGLAYHRLGMFTAAVKSYGRAIELDSSRVFALIESGNIQLMLGYFRKGVEQFRSALELAPHNQSAYFGLASALLAWARYCVTVGAFGWAASLLKEASEAAKVCTSLTGNLSCVWKLYGDVQLTLARCFPWVDGKIRRGMDEQMFKDSILEWRNACLSAANGAKLSYQRALHLAPWEANVHNDTAICLDLVYSMSGNNVLNPNIWELPEKMSLGALILEPVNKDFWVTLGSISNNLTLKQHTFIRALHLDMSLSEAWAYLGKVLQLTGSPVNESFESCLRAVQILPLPEFQIGLGTIAARSSNLLSPQVLMAIRQAVQRAPHYPESHNINGLVSEVRSDFQSAITFYQQARFALGMMNSKADNRYAFADVSVNLARSLCRAGLAADAVRECEQLRTQGLLNIDGLQIYALALWKIGRREEALSVSRNLTENLSGMAPDSASAALGFICTLTYEISGKESAAAVIHKLPGQLSYSTQLKFIISALDAMQPNKRFQLPQLNMPPRLTSNEVMSEVHSNIALGKAIGRELDKPLRVNGSLSYLKKVLHMYPDCSLVRNEYMKCLQNHTNIEIGWVMLKHMESVCSLEGSSDEIVKNLQDCVKRNGSDPLKWASLFNLASAQCFIWDEDFVNAEKALAQACAEGDTDSCILFLNGATCMEIAWRFAAPQFISRAAYSLRKAQQKSLASLPIVSMLLAKAEGSLGSKTKWEKNLRLEWFSWSPELRPAEVYFQMHLLARQSSAATSQHNQLVETMQSPERWLLRAIHQNPSCSRYWKALLELMDV
ncbi:hypothetical protein PR202_ga07754 [Eleusine coracana subsp. coracana]|uniref:Uncharacterized protein n=1 Tax=Eleusine coracana subsp. coracana TaxID=191504 RepID=A0AAV5C0E3_ELECO|nr:hypothetical protein PR202_ga07754 [Eleusine coracana subsp. coracana]